MSKGIIIYALNNEQIDYVKIAYHAAKQAKKYLNVPIAIVTDSAGWLVDQYPDYREVFDFLIKIVHESDVGPWTPHWNFKVNDLAFYNGTIWRKVKEGDEVVEVIETTKSGKEKYTFKEDDFVKEYEGIDIDKWYPNLPYLKGQHVWYENILYRCEVGYTEGDKFSENRYSILLENVKDGDNITYVNSGDLFLYNRNLWRSITDIEDEFEKIYSTKNLDPVYVGIDIDKWYPNLPYLKGQHVWHEDTLYRCHTDYEEQETFTIENYDLILENVKELTSVEKLRKGEIFLYDRSLYMSNVDYDYVLYSGEKIRDDLWEDTRERHLVFDSSIQYRRYFDGSLSFKRLKFKNDIRIKSFELSPFDETLVIDCDYYINNDNLKYCWEQPHDFLIFKQSKDLTGYRHDPRLHTVSDKGVDFYWATVFFFKKNKNTETFFNLLGHIQDNWNYYRHVYQIEHSLYRNDYAYSIGIHIMNGYQKGTWANGLPGSLYYTTDRDLLLEYNETEMKFLLEKEKYRGEYTLIKTNSLNVHVMNKFSLIRLLDQLEKVEYSY